MKKYDVMAELAIGCCTADDAIADASVASSVAVAACMAASSAIILIQNLMCLLLIEMDMASTTTVIATDVVV